MQGIDVLHQKKWGIFMHVLSDLLETPENPMTTRRFNQFINHFDVEKLAGQLHDAGAGYFGITLGQNSGYYIAPNPVYDRIVKHDESRCAERDLVADLIKALKVYDIPLMLYLPANAPFKDELAIKAFHFKDIKNTQSKLAYFQRKWEAVIHEWSMRYGKSVFAWWIDGCYLDGNRKMYESDTAPNFKSFVAALKAGNPEAAVAFNPGVADPELITACQEEDYTAGECEWPQKVRIYGRFELQAQSHVLSYIGKWWGFSEPRFNQNELIQATLNITQRGGAITYDVPFNHNDGSMPDEIMTLLTGLKKAVNPTRQLADAPELALPRLMINPILPEKAIYPVKQRTGKLQIALKNTRSFPISGVIEFAGKNLNFAPDNFHYQLSPGASCAPELKVKINPGNSSGVLSVKNSIFNSEIIIPRQQIIDLSCNQTPEFTFINSDGENIGKLTLASSGDGFLYLNLQAKDDLHQLPERIFEGSVLEIFLADNKSPTPLRQYFIPFDKMRRKVLILNNFKPLEVSTSQVNGDYAAENFNADVKLPLLPGKKCRFEAALHTGINGKYQYITLFKSRYAAGESKFYAKLKF